jgi:hypothetical protein
MPDPLDALLPAHPQEDIDPLRLQVRQEQRQRATAALMTSTASPEVAAQANDLSRQTGLPADFVERNLGDLQRQQQDARAQRLMQQYPAIGRWGADPRNAAVGRDSLPELGRTADLWGSALAAHPVSLAARQPLRPLPGAPDATYLGASTRTGFNSVASVFFSASASMADPASAFPGMPAARWASDLIEASPVGKIYFAPKRALARLADEQNAAGQAQFDRLSPGQKKVADLRYATTDPSKAAYLSPTRVTGDVLQSLPTMAALAVTGYLTRGAAIRGEAMALVEGMSAQEAKAFGVKAAAKMAARVGALSEGAVGYHQQKVQTRGQVLDMTPEQLSASSAYRTLLARGYSAERARETLAESAGERAGAIAGIVDAGTNLIGGPILGRIIGEGGSIIPRVAKGFGTEATTEAVQSAGEQLGGNLALQDVDPHQKLMDGVLESTLQGFVVGGASGGAMAGTFGRAHDEQVRAERALISGTALGKAMEAAGQNKVRGRDAEAFRQFIDMHTKGTPAETLFVPAEAVSSYFQSADEDYRDDPFWSQYADQIEEGLATGGDIAIPTATAAAHIAGTPAWEAIKEEVRMDAGGPSMAEAKQIERSRGAIMEKLGADMAAQEMELQQASEPHRRNYDAMREKLAAAGFTVDAAHVNATLAAKIFAARADHLGTPLTGAEHEAIVVNRILPANLAPIVAASPGQVALKSVINVMRRELGVKTDAQLRGPSLVEWIAKQGGIEDKGGDIAAMGGDRWHLTERKSKKTGKTVSMAIPGRRKLIRPHDGGQGSMLGADGQQNSNSQDELAVRAQEAGFFDPGDRTTVNDLLEAIHAELRGSKRYAEDRSTGADTVRAAAEELHQILDEAGIDAATATDAQIAKAIDAYREQRDGHFQQADAQITGDEIAPAGTPTPELRKAARAWYDEHLKGHSFPSEALGRDVQFAGSRKAFNSSADPRKLRAFAALPELIRNARLINSTPPRDPQVETSTKAYHYLEGAVSIGGEAHIVGVTVREDAAGNLYYNHSMQEGAPKDPEDTASKAGPGVEGRPLRQDIAQNADGINMTLRQGTDKGPRGQVSFIDGKSVIDLFQSANMSTFSHELGHHLLEQLRADVTGPAATDRIRADWQAFKDWAGANGHNVTDEDIPTEAHELFARGFERFLMEGKAPSSGLKRVFDAFRGWMLQIYKVVENLRSPITPEIREVMQRLVATEEEIDDMRERQAISSLFSNAAQAGMTEEAFAAHEKAAQDARDAAHDALLYKTMHAMRAAKTKAWKEEEVGVREDVTTKLNSRPEFRALHLLRTGRMLDDPSAKPVQMKLDRAWLTDNYGEGIFSALPKGLPIYADKGADADEIAERVGFTTGDEMIRTLVTLEERKVQLREAGDKRSVYQALIDEQTLDEMRNRHGDVLTDGTIESEALAAVHNNRQGEVFAADLRALNRLRGSTDAPTPYALAREWAKEKIASGVVNDVVSGTAIQQYARAAAKAGKAAEIAMAKGDIDETFRQRQAQMLNSALVAEAKEMRDKLDTAISRLSRYGRRRHMDSMDQDYLDQIHALLEQVEFRDRSQLSINKQSSFEAWANARQAEGFDVVVPPSFAASLGTIHWSRLTVERLVGLDDTVQQIAHIGRLKQELLDGQEKRKFAEMIAEADSGMEGMPRKPVVDGFLDPSYPQKAWSFVLGVDAMMLKMETVFTWLDQGNPNGFFSRVIFQRFVDAQEQRRLRLVEMKTKLEEIRQRVPEAIRKTWGNKVELGLIDPETGRPAVMTRDQLIMLGLNLGNAGNAWKLAAGFGWNQNAILREIGVHLKAEEWTFIQETWDQIGTLWPDIAALERRINGFEPDKVEARPVQTPFGTLKGGYFPVVYDPARNLEVEKHAADDSDALFSKGYRRATTRAGSTHERTGFRAPILLSLSVIDRHVGEVIHDITHREAVMDANRFLNDPKVVRDIRETLGTEIQKQIQPWLRHIANEWASDAAGTADAEKFFKRLRTNATFVGIGFRLSTIKMQAAGLFNTAEVIGAGWVAVGVGKLAQHPIETTRFVLAASKEVAARMDNNDRDISDAVKREQAKFGFLSEAKLFGFHLIGVADRFVSVASWIGAYNKALGQKMTEQQAVSYADKVVRQSQGSGSAKDLAAIQRGKGSAGEAAKLTTMFYSYMSGFYQRQRTLGRDYNRAIRTGAVGDMPGLLARTAYLYFFPAIASELLGKGMPDCDDLECWTTWSGKLVGMSALGPIPVVRDIAGGVASGFGYNFTPASGLGRTVVGVLQDAKRLWDGDATKHATKDVMEAAGYATGMVPGQIATATQFLVDVSQGDQRPETFGQWYNGLATGKTEPKK